MRKSWLVVAMVFLGLSSCAQPEQPGAGAPDAGACSTGAVRCGGRCVVLATSNDNCGACGQPCAPTESCGGARCLPADCSGTDCAGDQLCLNARCEEKRCVDVVCQSGETCYQGTCRPESCGATACLRGFVCIGGACIEVACSGVSCASGERCRQGRCAAGCASSGACSTNPGSPCFSGSFQCDGGCVDAMKVAGGTSCGSGLVCDMAGACVACANGSACATNPGTPCRRGILQCGSGTPVCIDDTPVDAGVGCGSGRVCDSQGTCLGCVAGQRCATNPGAPCRDGTLSCAGGSAACVDATTQADAGTSCGTDLVCNASALCVSCAAAMSCSTNPTVCKMGTTSCATGAQRCIDSVSTADGTACGNSQVCRNGACRDCTEGNACSVNPTRCKAGVTSCSTGVAICVDSAANATNGLSCGTDMVCNGGGCVACVADRACTNNPDPCRVGKTSCLTGASTCIDTAVPLAGASCGPGRVCNGGVCLAATSCNTLKTANPQFADGVYMIDPESDAGAPYAAYCDMTHADGGWTLVFNLDTNDTTMRDFNDTGFWLNPTSTVGSVTSRFGSDFKGQTYATVKGSEVLIWAHSQGSEYSVPPAYARYTVATGFAGQTVLQWLALPPNTQLSVGNPDRSGKVVTPGAYARNAGDVFIDNGLPIIMNSTGAAGTDATNRVRFGTDFAPVCSIVNCNGHNVQGGYGGYHIRTCCSGYPLSYEAQPTFGYHPGPVGFGDNFVNNNGCGNSVWSNTCGPEQLRAQVDFAIFVR